MKFRAAYYTNPRTGQETLLTSPDQSHLSDDDLIAAATAEAVHADILSQDDADDPYPRLSRADFDRHLTIGEWTE